MSAGLFSGVSGLALGTGLYKNVSGLWSGASGFDAGFGGGSPFSGASLYLDFLAGAPLDSRITFTRGSNATLVDSTGQITYAPANLMLRSEEFDNAVWLKIAGGAASVPVVTANAGTAPDGTETADRVQMTLNGGTTTGDIANVAQSAAYPSGSVTLTIWMRSNTGSNQTVLIVSGNAQAFDSPKTVTPTWQRFSMTQTLTAGSSNSGIRLRGTFTGGTADILVWGAQLEPVTYQTTPSTYVATTSAAYYGPRFDYDPVTLAPKGLLIEEQRVNAILQSQTLETTWTRGNILAFGSGSVVNAIASPDGTTTAEFIVPDTTGSVAHFMAQSVSHTAASYTISAYVKAGAYSKFAFRENTTLGTYATFNIGTGTVIETNGTATIQNAGNGWYRCTLTYTGAAVSQAMGLYVLPAAYTSGSPHLYLWAGDGTSGLYMWGVQDELGAFATSYIPTVASQVTRSADNASMTGTNFSSWYNQSEGTFVTSTSRLSTSALDGISVSAFTDGNNNIELFARTADNRLLVFNGGATQVNLIDTGKVSAGVPFATAAAYALNNYALTTNGGAVLTDTSATVPTAIALGIGSRSSNLFYNGHIRQIAYYNTRLPNATLQALTAPPLVTTLSLDFINGVYDA